MPGTRTKRGMYTGTQHGREHELDGRVPGPTPPKPTEGGNRGRPKGSKNRPKGLVPGELSRDILVYLRAQLSNESYAYVEGVLRDGKPIETKRELDVMIAMLARNLINALTAETLHLGESGFRKDITERLKILNSMLTLRHQIEKQSDDGDKPRESVLLKLVGDRSLLDGRLGILVGAQPRALAGDIDGDWREANGLGALPDQLPERSLISADRKQVTADRLLDDHLGGGASQGSGDALLQGELHLDQSD